MEFKIKFEKNLYKKLKILMQNIDSINNGDEIAAWFLGDWKEQSNYMLLYLDEMVIPKQTISGTSVDIDESDMIDTIKELGYEKCSRIKAHWHIHPFSRYKPSWSGTDDKKIEDFMDFKKDRDIFVFLLSGKDDIVARIIVNMKAKVKPFNKTISVQQEFEDVEILNEVEKDKTIIESLKKEIKSKVVKYHAKLENSCNKFFSKEKRIYTGSDDKYFLEDDYEKELMELSEIDKDLLMYINR